MSGPGILNARYRMNSSFSPGMHDSNGHMDLRKLLRGVIRLRALHQADIFYELVELIGC